MPLEQRVSTRRDIASGGVVVDLNPSGAGSGGALPTTIILQRVRAALEAGVAQPPKYLADLGGRPDVLMGEPSGESPVTAPAPPAPMAKFRVLDEETARLLDRLAREHPNSHLLLGILYVQAGVRAEAVGHLTKVQGSGREIEMAQRTLERLEMRANPSAAK